MTITKEKLDEIECGLEGVPDGPWELVDRPATRYAEADGLVRTATRSISSLGSAAIAIRPRLLSHRDWQTIGSHIARLDRKTVRELVRLANIGLEAEERGKWRREQVDKIIAEKKAAPIADADGWIEWKGGKRPVDMDVRVEVRFRSGSTAIDEAGWWNWAHLGDDYDIIAYRVVGGDDE